MRVAGMPFLRLPFALRFLRPRRFRLRGITRVVIDWRAPVLHPPFLCCPRRLPRRVFLALHFLRLIHARQLRAIKIAEAVARLRKRQAGQFLIDRVLSARLVDDDEAIAPVAVREHQPAFVERRFERLAAVRAFKAIKDRGADRAAVGAKAAQFLDLLAVAGARPVFRLTKIADFLKPVFFFELPAKLLEVVFIHAGVDRPHRLKIDAAPSDMRVLFAARLDMKADNARLVGEAKALFCPIDNLQPLFRGKMFVAVRVPDLNMEKRIVRFGVRLRHPL